MEDILITGDITDAKDLEDLIEILETLGVEM